MGNVPTEETTTKMSEAPDEEPPSDGKLPPELLELVKALARAAAARDFDEALKRIRAERVQRNMPIASDLPEGSERT